MQLPQSLTTVTLLSKILAIILFVSLPFVGYYLGNIFIPTKCDFSSVKKETITKTDKTLNNDTSTSWVKPASTDTGFPIVKDNILYWYSATKKELNSTKYQTSWGSGAYGLGEDNPLPSPDGKYIAFINRGDNQNLYLLSVGSNEAIRITNYPVSYLNSWSTDSSKILYYSALNNLEISKESEEMGGYPSWETNISFNQKATPGFHYFNISSGQDVFLYPLLTADKFIDKNRVLVEMKQNENNNQRLVLFNVDTFFADFSTVNYPIISFFLQKSFSTDASFWAKTTNNGNTKDGVKIIFSKFPNDDGVVVDAGSWAFIQKPLLNSSGKLLAYAKKGDKIEQGKYAGQYRDKTIVWDSSSQKTIIELSGYPQYWIDENSLLIGQAEYGNNPSSFTSFIIFHVNTKTSDTIFIK